MLVVTVDLHPFSRPGEIDSYGRIEIRNTGGGTITRGEYEARIYSKGKNPRLLRVVELDNFPRKRLTSMDLLYRVLHIAYGDRN